MLFSGVVESEGGQYDDFDLIPSKSFILSDLFPEQEKKTKTKKITLG
jgi:hypothetical protein